MSIPQVGGEGTKRFPFLLSTAVMLAVTVLSAMPAQAGFLNIGTVETFQTEVDPNYWTVGGLV
jgi:hypothetical protein